ncbi:MAG: FAD-dependent oxidoreductase, partial [Myxococcaceae bacterium]
ALVHELAGRGVGVQLSERVLEVVSSERGVEVHTDRRTLRCSTLVVAGGAWSGRIAGLPALPVRPMRGQMLTLALPGLKLSRILSGPTYLAPWRGGEVVVGATEEDAGFAQDTTPLGLVQLLASAIKVCPGVRDARFVRSWAGLRSSTPDGRPIIGPLPETPRVVVATGHGGQGILTGGLTGKAVAEWVMDGRSAATDAFRPKRA